LRQMPKALCFEFTLQKNALPDGRAQNKQISLIFRHRRIWHLAFAGCRVSQGRSLHRS